MPGNDDGKLVLPHETTLVGKYRGGMRGRISKLWPFQYVGVGPRIVGPPLVALLFCFCGRRLLPSWAFWPLFPWPWWLVGLGLVWLALGILLHAWSMLVLATAMRSTTLARNGPYAKVRHPAYAAWIFYLLPALTWLSGIWLALILPLWAVWLFRRHIGQEEAELQRQFGDEYDEYMREVPHRLLPLGKKSISQQ